MHFVRQCVRLGFVLTVLIAGRENPSDITTKPLAEEPFLRFRPKLGVVASEFKADGAEEKKKEEGEKTVPETPQLKQVDTTLHTSVPLPLSKATKCDASEIADVAIG
eukprot:1365830-Rhodomonas_salina.2